MLITRSLAPFCVRHQFTHEWEFGMWRVGLGMRTVKLIEPSYPDRRQGGMSRWDRENGGMLVSGGSGRYIAILGQERGTGAVGDHLVEFRRG